MKEVKNEFGVAIKKGCVSCEYKVLDSVHRFCAQGKGVVSKNDCCPKWEMSTGLKSAGKKTGKVKKKAYLFYLLNVVVEEKRKEEEAKERGERPPRRKSLKEIKERYVSQIGDIYDTNI